MAEIVSYAEAAAHLKEWTAALQATATGQSYSIGGRTLTRQDNQTIRAEIRRWHNTVTSLEADRRGETRPLGAQARFPTPGGRGRIVSQSLWEDGRT